MENEEFVKKVYLSNTEGRNRRGRPLGRWKDRVKEYVSERGVRGNGLEWARRECMEGREAGNGGREKVDVWWFVSRKAVSIFLLSHFPLSFLSFSSS